jgi:hypothetical protein
MGNKDGSLDIPGKARRRLRVSEVTVTCLLTLLLFSACVWQIL